MSKLPRSNKREERAKGRVIIEGFISLVGVNEYNRNVYHLHGFGYWVLPTNMHIELNPNKDKVVICCPTNLKWRKRAVTVKHRTVDDFLAAVKTVALYLHNIDKKSLLSVSIKYSWLTTILPSTGTYNGLFRVTVDTADAIRDKYPKAVTLYNSTSTDGAKEAIAEGIALKKEMLQLVLDRYQLTVEDTLVIHKTNPLLNK